MLLAAYLCTAMLNSDSYAGQELELELNKRLSDASKRLNLEFKFSEHFHSFTTLTVTFSIPVVSIVASLAFITVLFSIFIHFWFVLMTVQCAKYFRVQQNPKAINK